MAMTKMVLAMIALVILTVAGLVNIYQAMFDLFMMTYPSADANEWRTKLYIRLATAVLIGLGWIILAIWLIRQRNSYKLKLQSDPGLNNSSHSASGNGPTVD
jgi:hypothetical protein